MLFAKRNFLSPRIIHEKIKDNEGKKKMTKGEKNSIFNGPFPSDSRKEKRIFREGGNPFA